MSAYSCLGLPRWLSSKDSACQLKETKEMWVQSLGWEDPLEEEMAVHSSILAGRFHGQRSLTGYNPWGCKELDMTEQLSMHIADSLCCTAETDTAL